MLLLLLGDHLGHSTPIQLPIGALGLWGRAHEPRPMDTSRAHGLRLGWEMFVL